MKRLWEEFCVEVASVLPGAGPDAQKFTISLCGLCANTGFISHDAISPAGVKIHLDPRPCICPNGRAVKKGQPRPPKKINKLENGLTRYWMSWKERAKDYRPLTSPPNKHILGWWCSGYAGDESYSTIVAWVEAKTEAEAKKAIAKDWPGKRQWRFVNPCEPGYVPGDRFPLSDWMQTRAGIASAR